MERYSVWSFERGRERLVAPTETSCIIYDMRGFGLKNMGSAIVDSLVSFVDEKRGRGLSAALLVASTCRRHHTTSFLVISP